MEDLETLASNKKKPLKERVIDYLVDSTATTIFYTPPFIAMEKYIAQMETPEIVKSRLMAMGLHYTTGRPYGIYRKAMAKKFKIDKKSSRLKKNVFEVLSLASFQIPCYSSVLYLSGVSLEEGVAALGVGLMIGAGTGGPYGIWLDKFRKKLGRESTLH